MKVSNVEVHKGSRWRSSFGRKTVVEVIGVNPSDRTVEVRQTETEMTWFVDAETFIQNYGQLNAKREKWTAPTLGRISSAIARYAQDHGLAIVRCGTYFDFCEEAKIGTVSQVQVMSQEAAEAVNDAIFAGKCDCRTTTEEMLVGVLNAWAADIRSRFPRNSETRLEEAFPEFKHIIAKKSRAEVFAEIEAKNAAWRAEQEAGLKALEEKLAAKEAELARVRAEVSP